MRKYNYHPQALEEEDESVIPDTSGMLKDDVETGKKSVVVSSVAVGGPVEER